MFYNELNQVPVSKKFRIGCNRSSYAWTEMNSGEIQSPSMCVCNISLYTYLYLYIDIYLYLYIDIDR